jgi:hypothetical protein
MSNTEKSLTDNPQGTGNILIIILLFGSVWGLLDALSVKTLSSFTGNFFCSRGICTCPLTAIVFGFFILAAALAIFRKPVILIGIGTVAALFKLLNFTVITLPVVNGNIIYQPVMNPAIAAFVTSLVFALIAVLLQKSMAGNIYFRIIVGLIAGFLSAIAFVYTTFYITHTHPLIIDEPWQFIIPFHGPVSAILGVVFLPLGYLTGIIIRQKAALLQTGNKGAFYLLTCITIVLCIVVSTLTA